MRPYYERNGITIYHGDAREVLPQLEPRSVDLVLADPPYGETSLAWDARVRGWLPLLPPLMKPSASLWCFGSMRFFMAEAEAFAGWKQAQDIVWEKHNGSGFRADRFKRVHEHVVQFYRSAWPDVYREVQHTNEDTIKGGKKRDAQHWKNTLAPLPLGIGKKLTRSVIAVRSCHGYAQHPTQKPVGIIEPLVGYSCPPGGLILDPFMGSGTTLVVAAQSGRRAIGCEIEERYCEIAAKRLQQSVLPLEVAA